jgi:hypothetical protein
MLDSKFISGILVAGAVIVGWTGAWLTLDESPTPVLERAEADNADQLAALDRELDQLRAQLANQAPGSTVREVIREVPAGPLDPGDPSEDDEAVQAEPLPSDPFGVEQAQQAIVTAFDRFDERLANEDRDPDWAPRAEASIDALTSTMREQGFASVELLTRECGTGICRAEFSHTDSDEQRRFLHELIPQPNSEFVQFDVRILEDEHGNLLTEAFLVRVGHDVG